MNLQAVESSHKGIVTFDIDTISFRLRQVCPFLPVAEDMSLRSSFNNI